MNIKKDFPIFKNNPGLIYLDSTASSQKPSLVID
jgi:cysteine desulfurase/selenocysteine lyase